MIAGLIVVYLVASAVLWLVMLYLLGQAGRERDRYRAAAGAWMEVANLEKNMCANWRTAYEALEAMTIRDEPMDMDSFQRTMHAVIALSNQQGTRH